MSTTLVTGGTGTLGSLVVERLLDQGHEVRLLSRRAGAGTHVGDLSTGVGIAEAAGGAELIVHAASDVQRFGRSDPDQTAHLLQVARGARHLLYVSIVGIDQIPFPYYRRKLECEQQVAESDIPHTILRATQFHELIAWLLRGAERLPVALLPLDFRFQTVAAADAAARVAEVIGSEATGRIVSFGGPEVMTLREMTEKWSAARGRPRRTLRLPLPGAVARAFREGRNTCPEESSHGQRWEEFVAAGAEVPYRVRVAPWRLSHRS
jgi:uncharacterized protein YbjT (DUF2867 family)